MVITKDLSRLGRDYIQTGHYLERYFPEKRVRYVSLLDNIDTGIDSSINDITPFKAIMNDMYAKDISKKIKSVKHDKMNRGLFIGGKASYGYKKDPDNKNKIIIDPEASVVIKKIFEYALAGKSGRQIAQLLTAEGILSPAKYANIKYSRVGKHSGKWTSERVTEILRNECYIGNMVQGRKKKVNYKSKLEIRMPKDQWIVVQNTHEPIIAKEDFDKVQEILNKRVDTRCGRQHDYLLRGLVICKDCKVVLTASPKDLARGLTLYYRCPTYTRFAKSGVCTSHSARIDIIEELVLEEMKKVCKRYINKEKMLETAKKELSNNKNKDDYEIQIQSFKKKLLILDGNIDRLYNDKLDGLLGEEDFRRIYANKQKEKEELGQKIVYYEKTKPKSIVASTEYVHKVVNEFISMKHPTKQMIYDLIDKIELSEDKEITIHFKFKELDKLKD